MHAIDIENNHFRREDQAEKDQLFVWLNDSLATSVKYVQASADAMHHSVRAMTKRN